MSRIIKSLMRLLIAGCVLLVFASTGVGKGRYILISHAPDSDLFWNILKNAIKDAAEDFGVDTLYRNPANGDMAEMARLVDLAAAQNFDGVISTIADYDVLEASIKKVVNKKIPFVTINSGTPQESLALRAVMHIGQPEELAGKLAGEKAKAAGVKSFLCVNHYAFNAASYERCKGFGGAIGVDYRSSTIDSGDDPNTIESRVSAYLRANPDTGAILTLGPTSAHPTLRVVKKMGLANKIYFITFDISDEITAAIKDGTIKFAIDQQPYLQGYVAVAVLVLMNQNNINLGSYGALDAREVGKVHSMLKSNSQFKARLEQYGLVPVYESRNISSGPGFVDKSNLQKVLQYAGTYR